MSTLTPIPPTVLSRPLPFLQLERKGYFIVDRAFDPATPNDAMVLLNIPDGRAKAMPGMPAP